MLGQWCSLSMHHRTCENMPWGIGLGGPSMPTGWCTLQMYIYFQPWGNTKYSVPYIVHIVLTYISFTCGIVNPYVDGFLNSCGNAMIVCPYYFEIILCGRLDRDATVVVYRGFLLVLFESFSKGPGGLSYIFLITQSVDGPTFVFHGVIILRGDQDVLMVLFP